MKSVSWSQKQLQRHDRLEDYLGEDENDNHEDNSDDLNAENMLDSFDADNSLKEIGSSVMSQSVSSANLIPSQSSVVLKSLPAEKSSTKFKPLKISVSGSKQKVTIFKTPECEYIC